MPDMFHFPLGMARPRLHWLVFRKDLSCVRVVGTIVLGWFWKILHSNRPWEVVRFVWFLIYDYYTRILFSCLFFTSFFRVTFEQVLFYSLTSFFSFSSLYSWIKATFELYIFLPSTQIIVLFLPYSPSSLIGEEEKG